LCHRRDLDLWNLPGGGVQSGELPTEAVIRETQEETGAPSCRRTIDRDLWQTRSG
jgi:8-oxo-dGTP pyrophosphatase MutT (NUDIX family)